MADDWEDVPVEDHKDDWEDVPVNPKAEPGLIERGLTGAKDFGKAMFQGATAGEGVPILGPIASKAGTAFGAAVQAPFSEKSFGELYNKGREREENAETRYAEDNPVAAGTKSLAGGMMLPMPGVGLAGAAKAAPSLIRGAAGVADTVIPNMASSYGDTWLRTGDSDQAAEVAKDAGLLSGGLKAAGSAGSTIFNKMIPQGLAGAAEERAFKAATGQNKKAFKDAYLQKAKDIGREVPEGEATTKVNQIGRDLLTKDEAGAPVVGWFDDVKNIASKADAKAKSFGKQIGDVGSEVDNLVPSAVSGENISKRISDYAEQIPNIPSKESLKNKLVREAESYKKNGNLSFEDAQRYKNQYQFKPVDGGLNELPQDVTNAMRSSVGREMDDTVSKLASSPETNPDVQKKLELYNYLKQKYGSFKSASKSANDRVMADLSNRFVSPSDYGAGGLAGLGAMMTGGHDPITAAAVGAAGAGVNKLVRTRGNAFAARSLDTIDKVVNSPAGKQFKAVLEKAAERGPQALILTHEMLKRNDANYKKLTEGTGP